MDANSENISLVTLFLCDNKLKISFSVREQSVKDQIFDHWLKMKQYEYSLPLTNSWSAYRPRVLVFKHLKITARVRTWNRSAFDQNSRNVRRVWNEIRDASKKSKRRRKRYRGYENGKSVRCRYGFVRTAFVPIAFLYVWYR